MHVNENLTSIDVKTNHRLLLHSFVICSHGLLARLCYIDWYLLHSQINLLLQYNAAPYYMIVQLCSFDPCRSWIVCWFDLNMEFRVHAPDGVSGVALFITNDLPHTNYASKGLSHLLRLIEYKAHLPVLHRITPS